MSESHDDHQHPVSNAFLAHNASEEAASDIRAVNGMVDSNDDVSTPSFSSTLSMKERKKKMMKKKTKKKEEEDVMMVTQMYVIPKYLRRAMAASVHSKGAHRCEIPNGTLSTGERAPLCPIIVFINPKSGGCLGPALRSHLIDFITEEQVYDLSVTSPGDFFSHGLRCLEEYGKKGDMFATETREKIRVLVAGGDGTVGWVLGSLTELHIELHKPVPPVGIIPLGTGNDLARSFGWGGSFPNASRSAVKKYLLKAAGSKMQPLDSWQISIKTSPELDSRFPHSLKPQQEIVSHESKLGVAATFRGIFYNYFSIGMDAQVAYGFHHLRNKAPYLAQGPVSNKMIYSGFSCTQGWFCAPPQTRILHDFMHIKIKKQQTSDWELLELPTNLRAVVILNLQSYAAGRNPWGHPSGEYNEKKGFVVPKLDDGFLELFGLYDGWHTSFVMVNLLNAKRLAQAHYLQIDLWGGKRNRAYMQLDGEPWEHHLGRNKGKTRIEISCASSVMMLKAIKVS